MMIVKPVLLIAAASGGWLARGPVLHASKLALRAIRSKQRDISASKTHLAEAQDAEGQQRKPSHAAAECANINRSAAAGSDGPLTKARPSQDALPLDAAVSVSSFAGSAGASSGASEAGGGGSKLPADSVGGVPPSLSYNRLAGALPRAYGARL